MLPQERLNVAAEIRPSYERFGCQPAGVAIGLADIAYRDDLQDQELESDLPDVADAADRAGVRNFQC